MKTVSSGGEPRTIRRCKTLRIVRRVLRQCRSKGSRHRAVSAARSFSAGTRRCCARYLKSRLLGSRSLRRYRTCIDPIPVGNLLLPHRCASVRDCPHNFIVMNTSGERRVSRKAPCDRWPIRAWPRPVRPSQSTMVSYVVSRRLCVR